MSSSLEYTITEDHLTCQICLLAFTKPKALPCLHTFCELCLKLYVNKNQLKDTMLCPTCRTEIKIPENGVVEFPINHFFTSLQDTLTSRTGPPRDDRDLRSPPSRDDYRSQHDYGPSRDEHNSRGRPRDFRSDSHRARWDEPRRDGPRSWRDHPPLHDNRDWHSLRRGPATREDDRQPQGPAKDDRDRGRRDFRSPPPRTDYRSQHDCGPSRDESNSRGRGEPRSWRDHQPAQDNKDWGSLRRGPATRDDARRPQGSATGGHYFPLAMRSERRGLSPAVLHGQYKQPLPPAPVVYGCGGEPAPPPVQEQGREGIVHLSVPVDVVGRIIGTKGSRIQEMARTSGAHLRFLKSYGFVQKGDGEVLEIKGSQCSIDKARKNVQEIIDDAIQIHTDTMDVPDIAIGRIIGKGGANIQAMHAASGAKITTAKLSNETPDSITMHRISIRGKNYQILKAKEQILEILGKMKTAPFAQRSQPVSDMSQLLKAQTQNDEVPRRPPRNIDNLKNDKIKTTKQSLIEINIPQKLMRNVTGHQWTLIQQVEAKSHATIQLRVARQPSSTGEVAHQLIICGTLESTILAEKLIQELKDAIHIEMSISVAILRQILGLTGDANCNIQDICQLSYEHAKISVSTGGDETNPTTIKRITISGKEDDTIRLKGLLETLVNDAQQDIKTVSAAAVDSAGQDSEDDFFKCGCCFDDEVWFQEMGTCDNGHLFCQSCIQRSCEVVIGQGKVVFPCLAADCEMTFSTQELRAILPERLHKSILHIMQTEEIRQTLFSNVSTRTVTKKHAGSLIKFNSNEVMPWSVESNTAFNTLNYGKQLLYCTASFFTKGKTVSRAKINKAKDEVSEEEKRAKNKRGSVSGKGKRKVSMSMHMEAFRLEMMEEMKKTIKDLGPELLRGMLPGPDAH